jgi:hypothetical protein
MNAHINEQIYNAFLGSKGTITTFEEESGEYIVDLNKEPVRNGSSVVLKYKKNDSDQWQTSAWRLHKIEKVGNHFTAKTEPCPRCSQVGFISETDVVEETYCITCENKGYITPQHLELLNLGFGEHINDSGYSLRRIFKANEFNNWDLILWRDTNIFTTQFEIAPAFIGDLNIDDIILSIKTNPEK